MEKRTFHLVCSDGTPAAAARPRPPPPASSLTIAADFVAGECAPFGIVPLATALMALIRCAAVNRSTCSSDKSPFGEAPPWQFAQRLETNDTAAEIYSTWLPAPRLSRAELRRIGLELLIAVKIRSKRRHGHSDRHGEGNRHFDFFTHGRFCLTGRR